jgi:phosphoenolpyruvate carboxylase
VASRWALFEAQQEMVALCDELGVSLELFHGRGGTVSRGGSKPREGILCAPDGAVRGHLRVTEQGEIIRAKFGLEPIASRTLELMGAAILERGAALPTATPVSPARARAMSIFADASRAAFRGLIYDDPGFFSYFRDATPIDVIERLRIGSRPSARRKQRGIEDLRAIPWVFSWTQSRHILPGWFGVGAGLAALERELGIDELRTLSRAWPFFTNLLNDVEMVLAKADMDIARRYAELCVEQGPRIFSRILEEYQRTVSLIERVREQALLASEPVLARAIALRNPYVDPMSLIQIDLLARWRASDREDADLERALVTTVQGIARGLQNTG